MSVETSYLPGSWLGAVTDRAWLLTDLPPSDPRVGQAWRVLQASGGTDEVLEALLGGGLAALPAFGLVVLDEGAVRILVRRSARVLVLQPGGTQRIHAAAGTWTDVTVAPPLTGITIVSGPVEDTEHWKAEAEAPTLPVAHGIAQASQITVRWAEGPAGHASAGIRAAAPAVAVAPEPSTADPTSDPAGVEDSGADRTDYADLFAGTASRADLLDRLAAEVQDDADSDEENLAERPAPGEPDERDGGRGDEPSHLTEIWPHTGTVTAAAVAPTATGRLIDGVPWAAPTPAPTYRPSATARNDDECHDDAGDDEVDVRTIGRAELVALTDAAPAGPSVLATRCPSGHLTAPFAPGCRICGQPVDAAGATRVARPVLGTLRRAGGDPIVLDRDVVLGRAPQVSAAGPAERPNLVRIADPGISRNHVQITLDGWQVLVRDLGSSNGTQLQLPGQEIETLRANEDYLAEPGSRIIVAGDVVFTYEIGT